MPTVTCPGCGRRIHLAPGEMGLKIQCAQCDAVFRTRSPTIRVTPDPDPPAPAPAHDSPRATPAPPEYPGATPAPPEYPPAPQGVQPGLAAALAAGGVILLVLIGLALVAASADATG